LPKDFYRNLDIHLPRAGRRDSEDGRRGITICTSIVSALTKIPVRCDVAMTGKSRCGQVLDSAGEENYWRHRMACSNTAFVFVNLGKCKSAKIFLISTDNFY